MLPVGVLERISAVNSVRSFSRTNERREKIRIPVSLRAIAMPITGSRTGAPSPVRVKDVSACGLALLVQPGLRWTPEVVLAFTPQRGGDTYYLMARLRRSCIRDGVCIVLGASWEKVLHPGLEVRQGTDLSTLLWVDVAGDVEAEDPWAESNPRPRRKAG